MLSTFTHQFLFLFSLLHLVHLQSTNPPPAHHWDYEREGPDTWPHAYETCEGEAQSPINIRSSYVKYDPTLTPLSLNGYTGNMSSLVWNFTHNGHTIVAYPPPLARLSMSGGGLPDVFYLVQFHFHWGYNAFQGSEHTINDRRYPLEVHFVHRAPFTGTLAVLGILFDRQRDDNPYLNDLLSVLNRTVNTSISVEQQIDLSRLLPTSPSPRFYRYNGSLTTPPCTEGVIWTLLTRTVPMSSYQVRALFNNIIPFNFRPPQKLHSRKVLANFRPEPHEGGEEGEIGEGAHHSSASSNRSKLGQLLFILFVAILPISKMKSA
jgi:carbonic anhydrase